MSTENVLLVFDKWWNENSWNPWVIQETNQNIYISKWIGEGYEAKKKKYLRGQLQGEKLPLSLTYSVLLFIFCLFSLRELNISCCPERKQSNISDLMGTFGWKTFFFFVLFMFCFFN